MKFTKSATQPDGDETELVANRQNRTDGRFQGLEDKRYALGFKERRDQYGASAYSKRQSSADEEYELEPTHRIAPKIHVSKTIDVFSSQYNDEDDKPRIEHV